MYWWDSGIPRLDTTRHDVTVPAPRGSPCHVDGNMWPMVPNLPWIVRAERCPFRTHSAILLDGGTRDRVVKSEHESYSQRRTSNLLRALKLVHLENLRGYYETHPVETTSMEELSNRGLETGVQSHTDRQTDTCTCRRPFAGTHLCTYVHAYIPTCIPTCVHTPKCKSKPNKASQPTNLAADPT